MFGVWVKILKFAGMLFLLVKVTSEKSVPEVSIIHFSQFGSHRSSGNEGINFYQFLLKYLGKS